MNGTPPGYTRTYTLVTYTTLFRAHQVRVRDSRHRAGDDVRDSSVHRARTDSADAGTGHRLRTGSAVARRIRLADVLARDVAEHQMGSAVRRTAMHGARDGRVRRRDRKSVV